MTIGLAVGVAGTALLVVFMRRVRLPSEGLYPIRTLAAAGVIYGLAAVAHGSGFLAVFIAGLALGELDVPHKRQIRRFHTALASLAEIVVFVALGLTVNVVPLFDEGVWLDGLLLAVALAFVARPVGLAPLLAPMRLRVGEKVFIAWGGLKGAVPILLAAFVILAEVHDARRVYEIVFVVVLFSVVVQGSTVPFVASRLGIPMRVVGR
jgi:cell volume regulation protein A